MYVKQIDTEGDKEAIDITFKITFLNYDNTLKVSHRLSRQKLYLKLPTFKAF